MDEWISDRARFSYDSFLSSTRLRHFAFTLRSRAYTISDVSLCTYGYLLKRALLFGKAVFDWFPPERARFLASLDARLGLRHVQAGSPYGSDCYHFTSGPVRSIFIAGISLRYTHPVYFLALRRLHQQIPVFELGESNQVSLFSLGAGIGSFFYTFRFRARASSLLFGSTLVTSRRFYHRVGAIFNSLSCFVLPESPSCLSVFSSSSFSICFGSYRPARCFDFLVPLTHPYEVYSVFYRSDDRIVPQVSVGRRHHDIFSPFFLERSLLRGLQRYPFVIPDWFAQGRLSNLYSTYNHYDHFFGWSFLSNSNIIMLNLKRNEDLRHSHFCSV